MEGVIFKKLPQSQCMWEITVPAETVNGAFPRACEKLGAGLEIKGFRKGKAPLDAVRRCVGEEKIFQEASFLVMEEKYAEAAKESGVRIAGHPTVEVMKIAPGNPLVFQVTAAVYPEVTLPDYKEITRSIKHARAPVLVTEEEVNNALAWLCQSRRKEALVPRPAKEGDRVEVDFESRIAGVKVDGGDSRNHPFVLGKSKFADGFDAAVAGMSEGEEKMFSLDVPASHARAEMRGKRVDFKVKMNGVYEVTVPDADDAFAQSIGGFADKEALVSTIREGLQKEKEEQEKESFRSLIARSIAEKTRAEIADVLRERETDKMIAEFSQGLAERGLDMDGYLSSLKKTKEEMRGEIAKEAEMRVKIALTLGEIAQKEGITASPEEVRERVERILQKENKEDQKRADRELISQYVSGIIRNEKVFALLESGMKNKES